jgi:hypothetical protein
MPLMPILIRCFVACMMDEAIKIAIEQYEVACRASFPGAADGLSGAAVKYGPDIYDGEPWTEMAIEDLKNHVAHGRLASRKRPRSSAAPARLGKRAWPQRRDRLVTTPGRSYCDRWRGEEPIA